MKSNLTKRVLALLLCCALLLPNLTALAGAEEQTGTSQSTTQTGSGEDALISGISEDGIASIAEGQLVLDKTVAEDADHYMLTLEAFSTGSTTQVSAVAPADIVLVLDQSSSMYTPLGWTKDRVNLEGGDTYSDVNSALSSYKISDFVTQARAEVSDVRENAKRLGYYIAVHNEGNYMYLVHYAQNSSGQWGWYYISIDQTTRSIDMDVIKKQYDAPSGDSSLDGADYKAIVYNNGGVYDLLTNVTYYKSQYGALVESVESFVSGLQKSGVAHRLGIVGFASPFYDGWDHYDGSGLYVNGNFYLYDTDFMYRTDEANLNTTNYVNGGFVETDWTGDTILDPDLTFATATSPAQALDTAVIQNAYANSIIVKNADGTATGETMYGQALADVSDETAYKGILNSIDAINANYQQTCPSVGIEIAENIFAARSEETSDRDKIIVLFTDGVPTVRLYTNRHHGFSNDVFAKSLYWSISGGVEDALDRAVKAKANGVQIYTIGTAAMESATIYGTNLDSGVFLNYLSSNYTAVSYGDPPVEYSTIPNDHTELTGFIMNNMYDGEGMDKDPDQTNPTQSNRGRQYAYYDSTPDGNADNDELIYYYTVTATASNAETDYAQFASASDGGSDLNVAFGTIMESITVPTVTLDGSAVLRDVLSDYFDLLNGTDTEVEVYTAAFNADGTVNTPVLLEGTVITFGKTDSTSDRYDVVDVTGYNYSEEYYSATPRTKDGSDYYGSKLIVKIPIKVSEDFNGGNDVPTNEPESAVYDDDTIVQPFPIPTVDVPGVVTNKYVTPVEGSETEFIVSLEAYATGSASTINITKPADIVLVLDHSGSMRTPVGASDVLISGIAAPDEIVGTEIPRSQLDVTKAKHIGYYVAQDTSDNYWYIMENRDDLVIDGATVSGWRGYKVNNTEAIIDPGNPNNNGYNQIAEVDWRGGTVPETMVFYKSQYAMLYDSVLGFVTKLQESEVEHSVAIIGFAGSLTQGSRIYLGFDDTNDAGVTTYRSYASYESMALMDESTPGRHEFLYQQAMKSVQDPTEYEQLLSNIENIETNYSYTCPAAGLDLANRLMEANPINSDERDRIVVFFTDGIPNSKIGADGTDDEALAIYEEIVGHAYYSKENYGAKVYSISTSTLGTEDRTFLSYLSSDYPNAVNYSYPGSPISEPKYTKQVNSISDMDLAFNVITQKVSNTTVSLDDSTVLLEILTKYFELNGDSAVTISTQAYDGVGGWGEKVPLTTATYEISSSQGNVEGAVMDTIEVSGFHYTEEYISEVARDKDGADYYGSKLVVDVAIKTRDGFWGGNNVPTNDADTGLYSNDELVQKFPEPEANVSITPEITANDVIIYYGGDVNESDLGVTVEINGVEVIINADGTLTPKESWMSEFATLTWADPSMNPADSSDPTKNTEKNTHEYTVVLNPKTDGSSNLTDSSATVGGDVIQQDTQKATAQGTVNILVPVLTFQDSTIEYGTTPDKAYYEENDKVVTEGSSTKNPGVTWVLIDTNSPPTDTVSDTEPELTITYTPVGNTAGDPSKNFKVDTKIDVTVTSTNDNENVDIMDVITFQWTECGSSFDGTDAEHRIDTHEGTADTHEFWIHVGTYGVEDQVVIDFGLSVTINVLTNDHILSSGTTTLIGLASSATGAYSDTFVGKYGTATIVDGKVTYSLHKKTDKDNNKFSGMEMYEKESFYYVLSYTLDGEVKYYYAQIHVIPATIVYFEDDFIDYSVSTKNEDGTFTTVDDGWEQDGTTATGSQQEDRPGEGLDDLDPSKLYGYDAAYTKLDKHSYGSAMKVNVKNGKYATASFSFWGTGFDVISLTSCTTGTIVVKVTDKDGAYVVNYMVDTYYGYIFADTDGDEVADAWIVDTGAEDNALYQVPVIKVDLNDVERADGSSYGYGYYNVEIVVSYGAIFDHKQCTCEAGTCDGCYDFYLDAIRIYDPANNGANDSVIKDAYIMDDEYAPTYEELRNQLISLEKFENLGDGDTTVGVVFIDGNGSLSEGSVNGGSESINDKLSAAVTEYANYGPNNELYLASNQAVVFDLESVTDLKSVHLALKSVGGSATVSVYGIDADGTTTYVLNNKTIESATDLYYSIKSLVGKTVVIRNSGESGILSITNLKTTYVGTLSGQSLQVMSVSQSGVALALASLNETEPAPVEPTTGTIVADNASLILKDQVQVKIYFNVDGLDVSSADMGLITFKSEVTNGSIENADAVIPGADYDAETGLYAVYTNGIAAKNLGDEIWFRIYVKQADGSYVYSELLSYSPKTYASNILSGEYDTELKALVVAMLNYGAAAQEFFGYNTDALVNADLTAEQQALVAPYSADMVAELGTVDSSKVGVFIGNGGYSAKYPSVICGGTFAINYTFVPANAVDGDMTLYYWDEATYSSVEVLTAENATGTVVMVDNQAAVDGIAAKDMDGTVYVAAVYESEGETYCTGVLAYSVGIYCVRNAAGESAAVRSMVEATAVYGSYAKAYFKG